MLLQFKVPAIVLLVGALVVSAGQPAWAQQAQSKSPAKSTAKAAAPAAKSTAKSASPAPAAKPAASRAPISAEEAAQKAEILDSRRWRRAMFELNEWFSAQPFYDKKQVEEIKADLLNRVAEMSSTELEFMLEDMEAKFQIMDSPAAQEARQWVGQYLSMLSAKKREEVLKDLPNLATMTAAQLSQELQKIERKRTLRSREAAASSRTQQALVSNQMQANRAALQAARRQQSMGPDTYSSPYRTPTTTPGARPFDDRQVGPNMEFYSGNFGQFGVVFNPSSY